MKIALVIGYGISGQSAALFLKRKGYEVLTFDKNPSKNGEFPFFSNPDDIDLSKVDLAVLSPGIPSTHPLVQKVQQQKIELIGEVELACRYIKQPMIGITGTNGKTTVTLLITHVLNHAGIRAYAMGNVGRPLTDQEFTEGVIVAELSSYQLETLFTPILDQAILLNITPDHLDRYGTMEKYAEAKFLIQRVLKPQGSFLVDSESHEKYGYLETLSPQINPKQKTHDLENESAAFWAVSHYGVSKEKFDEALKLFKKPSHRIEYVTDIQGVRFIDDSKGTNIDAVLRAIDTIDTPIVLIAGGMDKGYPYTAWIKPFKPKVKKIIALGEAAPKIKNDLEPELTVEIVKTLEEATQKAFENSLKGDTVLLSPGCSSLDMFKDYAHRGQVFQQTVRGLKEKVL